MGGLSGLVGTLLSLEEEKERVWTVGWHTEPGRETADGRLVCASAGLLRFWLRAKRRFRRRC